MRLNLLDIDRFIEEKQVKQVTSQNVLDGVAFDMAGLWSETIFGRTGSRDRARKFGYIELKRQFIHPEVFQFIKKVSPAISKIISGEKKYSIIEGKLVEDDTDGETGITFLISIIAENKLNFNNIVTKEKRDIAEFIEANKDTILIDKLLIMPPGGFRDIDIAKKRGALQNSEINSNYQQIMYLSKAISGDLEFDEAIISRIQRTLQIINTFLKSLLKGKKGLLRNNMLNKSIDFSGRLILVGSPDIKLGDIGIPWSTLLTLYEPLFIYQLNKHSKVEQLIKDYLNIEDNLTNNAVHKLISDINKNPEIVELELRDNIITVLEKAIEDGVVLVKRDPVVGTKSWYSATPVILREGRIGLVSTLDLVPMGGDCDGDTILVAPVFSDEAKSQAKERMNARHSKLKWTDTTNIGNPVNYNLSLDAISTVFKVTKA